MFGNKKAQKPGKHDYGKLDKAVSELAKQTEILLGSTKLPEKNPKPRLSANQMTKKSTGRSFDIITKNQLLKSKSTPLIEARASEDKPINPKNPTPEAVVSRLAKNISVHPASEVDQKDEQLSEDSDTQKPAIEETESLNHQKALEFEVNDSEDTEVPADKTDKSTIMNHQASTIKPSIEAKADQAEKPETEKPAEMAEYGNTIISTKTKDAIEMEADDKNGRASISVFDTEEYHQPLHDWSKLEQRSRLPLVILLLLVAGAAVVGWYFFVRGK